MSSGYIGFSECVELPEQYTINLLDSYGDGWNGGILTVDGVDPTMFERCFKVNIKEPSPLSLSLIHISEPTRPY